jgi:MFS family permease
MSDSPKRTTSDSLLGLMDITGFGLVIGAVPLGVTIALEAHYCFRDRDNLEWHWAIILGAAMAIAAALVGSILVGVTQFLYRRRKKQ